MARVKQPTLKAPGGVSHEGICRKGFTFRRGHQDPVRIQLRRRRAKDEKPARPPPERRDSSASEAEMSLGIQESCDSSYSCDGEVPRVIPSGKLT